MHSWGAYAQTSTALEWKLICYKAPSKALSRPGIIFISFVVDSRQCANLLLIMHCYPVETVNTPSRNPSLTHHTKKCYLAYSIPMPCGGPPRISSSHGVFCQFCPRYWYPLHLFHQYWAWRWEDRLKIKCNLCPSYNSILIWMNHHWLKWRLSRQMLKPPMIFRAISASMTARIIGQRWSFNYVHPWSPEILLTLPTL